MVFHWQSGDDSGLYLRICELLVDSIEAHFSVAWMTSSAFDMINSGNHGDGALDLFLSNPEAILTITVGLSNRGTSYDVLDTLLQLNEDRDGTLEVYVRHTEGAGRIFHPKAYLFVSDSDDKTRLITGSNNLSSHGLGRSEEASIEIDSDNAGDAIQSAITNMFDVIEVDDALGPSRRLDGELLETLLESGLVLREGSGAWIRNRRKPRGRPHSGIFTPTSGQIPDDLPAVGSGRPIIEGPPPAAPAAAVQAVATPADLTPAQIALIRGADHMWIETPNTPPYGYSVASSEFIPGGQDIFFHANLPPANRGSDNGIRVDLTFNGNTASRNFYARQNGPARTRCDLITTTHLGANVFYSNPDQRVCLFTRQQGGGFLIQLYDHGSADHNNFIANSTAANLIFQKREVGPGGLGMQWGCY